jgi:regulator of sigma D
MRKRDLMMGGSLIDKRELGLDYPNNRHETQVWPQSGNFRLASRGDIRLSMCPIDCVARTEPLLGTTSDRTGEADRRRATRDLIDHLLQERQEMWMLYERLAGVGPDKHKADPGRLREFAQVLVDYIAAGHFGLYERIVSGQERRKRVVGTAEDLYPKIALTTDVSVAFNDKYDGKDLESVTDELARDLSSLGESLATRTELEDELIETLFQPA